MIAKVVIAALAIAPFVSSRSAALAQDCTRNYTIVSNDTCDSISAANNCSTYQLWALNYDVIGDNCTDLQPDSSLCLGEDEADCQDTYVVQSNDTCDSVATTYGINATLLYTNNPQLDEDSCDNLYIGEVVCVATTSAVPAAPSGTSLDTSIPATATLANAAASTSTSDDSDDDDDEDDDEDEDDSDLPYCDEL